MPKPLKKEIDELGKEFVSVFQQSLKDIENLNARSSDKIAERMRRNHAQDMEYLDEIMSSMDDVYSDMSSSLSELDKSAYKTLLINRRRDIRQLEREFKRRNRELTRAQQNFFSNAKEGITDLSDQFTRFMSISNALNIDGIKSSLDDNAASNLELRRAIKSFLALDSKSYDKMADAIISSQDELNKKYGYKFSDDAVAKSAYQLVSEMGYRDSDLVSKLSVELAKYTKATGDDGTQVYQSLNEMVRMNRSLQGYEAEIARYLNDLSMVSQQNGFATSFKDLQPALSEFATTISRDARTSDDAKRRLSEVNSMVTLANQFGMSSEAITQMVKGIGNSDLATLSQQYGRTGLDILGLRRMYQQGDYSEIANQLLTGIGRAGQTNNKDLYNIYREASGLEASDFDKIVTATKDNINTIHDSYRDIVSKTQDIKKIQGSMDKAIESQYVSWFDSISNYFQSTKIGREFTDIADTLDMSVTDIWMSANAFQIAAGSFAKASEWLSKGKISERLGSILSGGKGVIGGVATKLGGFGGVGKLGSLVGGLSGAATVAGALGGIAGLADAAKDLYQASNETTWQAKEMKQNAAVVKGGLVTAGAAIGSVVPGVGTLIGAGIGGLLALLGGNKVATVFTDWVNGTSEIESTLSRVTETQRAFSKATENQEHWASLEANYKRLNSELSKLEPMTDAYNNKLSELKVVTQEMQKIAPQSVKVESDGVTVKNESLQRTREMVQAERELARARADKAIQDAIKNEKNLANQLQKSRELAGEGRGVTDNSKKLLSLYNKVRAYDQFIESGSGGLTLKSGAPEDAVQALAAFNKEAKQLYNKSGLNSWFDSVTDLQSNDAAARNVYNELQSGGKISAIEDNLKRVSEMELDVVAKQNAYDSNFRNLSSAIRATTDSEQDANVKIAEMQKQFKYLTPDGSHKTGLWNVPKDGYKAVLHKGEMVLPEKEADKYRDRVSAKPESFIKRLFGGFGDVLSAITGSVNDIISGVKDSIISNFLGNDKNAPTFEGKYKDFMAMITEGAIASYKKYGVLPSITMAQGALESAWGSSAIGHNLFGIKAFDDWNGKKKAVQTQEVDANGNWYTTTAWFRDYDSFKDAVLDHGKLLGTSDRYAGVRNASNYVEAAQALGRSGYATDPDYGSKILSTIKASGFSYFDNPEVIESLAKAYGLPQYKQGTPFVPETGLSLLHKGEAVIPAEIVKRGIAMATSLPVGDSGKELIQILRWGFELLSKKMDATNNVISEVPEQTNNKESRANSIFRLGGFEI